jgi:hypothetical protein
LTLRELADLHTKREQVTEYFGQYDHQSVVHRIRKYSK